jgi:hypothetical protein
MSFYTMAFMGTAPFGSLIAGSLAKISGAPDTLLIGGIFCITGAVLFSYKLPEITLAIKNKRMESEKNISGNRKSDIRVD